MDFSIWNNISSLLFPQYCVVCHCDIDDASLFDAVCESCFLALRQVETPYIKTSILNRVVFYGSYHDTALRILLTNNKYYGARSLAMPLAELQARALEEAGIAGLCKRVSPVITYVPLHPLKERFRGYNQAHLLARELAKYFSLPLLPLLARAWIAPPQASLESDRVRKLNSKGAFVPLISHMPRAVILVDDIYTSGATLDAAGKILRKGGATTIWGVTVAGTQRHH